MTAGGLIAGCGTSPGAGADATSTAREASASSASASSASANRGTLTGTINETGSTLLYPLIKTWGEAYQQQVPGVKVTTAATGSGTGLKDASNGTADIGASDAYLSSGDLLRNPSLVNIPLAVSAQTVIYNVPGLSQQHIKLSGKVLAEMYSGAITTWNDPQIKALNGALSLPPTRVVPIHRDQSSGDTFLFTSYTAIGQGAHPAEALAQASIDVQQIRSDSVLNVIARSGSTSLALDSAAEATAVGPGTGSLLDAALAGGNAQAAPYIHAAGSAAPVWYKANEQGYALGARFEFRSEEQAVTGPENSDYEEVLGEINHAISAAQGTFQTEADAGSGAFGPLEAVVIVAALLMAAASAWGLSRRIAEYR